MKLKDTYTISYSGKVSNWHIRFIYKYCNSRNSYSDNNREIMCEAYQNVLK